MILRKLHQPTVRAVKARSGRIRLSPDSVNEELRPVFAKLAHSFLNDPDSLPYREPALALAGMLSEGIVLLEDALAFAKACSQSRPCANSCGDRVQEFVVIAVRS